MYALPNLVHTKRVVQEGSVTMEHKKSKKNGFLVLLPQFY
ncbi:hypothetical protein DSBG_4165 [Desulfosporosinus sp. BG]|nr:hypothetical protein DSBG_4165 [Desulfosporosinus sp. BG]